MEKTCIWVTVFRPALYKVSAAVLIWRRKVTSRYPYSAARSSRVRKTHDLTGWICKNCGLFFSLFLSFCRYLSCHIVLAVLRVSPSSCFFVCWLVGFIFYENRAYSHAVEKGWFNQGRTNRFRVRNGKLKLCHFHPTIRLKHDTEVRTWFKLSLS